MNNGEQLKISDLAEKKKPFLNSDDLFPYSRYYLKNKLIEQHGNTFFTVEGNSGNDVVTF